MPRTKLPAVFLRYRETHHALARYFALGWTLSKISHETGMSRRRLHIIANDPTFQELVQWYADRHEEQLEKERDEYFALNNGSTLIAARMLYDQLETAEEAGENLPGRFLLTVVEKLGDRTGRGPRSTHLNLNVDFAGKLDAAIDRSTRVIEGRPLVSHPPTTPLREDGPRLIEHQVLPQSRVRDLSPDVPVEVVRGSQLPRPSLTRRKVA